MDLPTPDQMNEWKRTLDADPAMIDLLRAQLDAAGLLPLLIAPEPEPEKQSLDPIDDWMACQVTVFDNGDQRDARGRPRASKTRYAVAVRQWRSDNPNWTRPDFQSNIPLWSPEFAVRHIDQLAKRGSISRDFADGAINAAQNEFHVGIVKQKQRGTRYRQTLAIADIQGVVKSVGVQHGDLALGTTNLVKTDCRSEPLAGNAVAMARLTKSDRLAHWQTELVD